jgi:hypothetical protein
MTFSEALRELKAGKLVRRECWQNQEVFVSFLEDKKVVLITDGNYLINYEPSDDDFSAEDWYAVEGIL